MTIRRREMVAAGMAAAAAVTLGDAAQAQTQAGSAPGAGQAPGWSRFTVGGVEVTMIHEGALRRPLEAGFVKNAELGAVQAALAAAFQPSDTLTIPVTTTVARIGERTILFDGGLGGFGPPGTGAWMTNFRAAGFTPEEVDLVVVSHFHGDHIQGLRGKDGAATFPAAAIHVPAAEWAFWMDDAQMARAPEAMKGAFQAVRRVFGPIAGEVVRYEGTAEIVPGVTPVPAAGHTPGHHAFLLGSGAERVLVWSDTTNKPELFVRNPGWHAVFDMDATAAEATRRRLLDMAATDRLRMTGYHFPFPANGYIARDEGSYAFVPAFWTPTL